MIHRSIVSFEPSEDSPRRKVAHLDCGHTVLIARSMTWKPGQTVICGECTDRDDASTPRPVGEAGGPGAAR